MRTIKFRGKRINDLEWVFGYYIGINNISHTILNDSGAVWTIDPATVGQFTGLTDKNGKEIYEGDIVRDYIGNCIYVFKFGTISYTVKSKLTDQLNDVTFTGFYVDIPKIGTEILLWSSVKESEIGVIGNVHENPELL